jgi:hypothetical protein
MIVQRIRGTSNGVAVGPLSCVYTPNRLNKIEKFRVQFAYGQREILLDYAGLDRSTLLMGILQHGFSYQDDDADCITPRLRNFRRSPLWVYSAKREDSLRGKGYKNVKAIGAPWLYLPPASISPSIQAKGDAIVVFPIHTSLSVNVSPSDSDIRRKICYWKSVAAGRPLTICLYWSDYLEWSWRRIAYEEGVEITVVGVGELNPVWSPHSTRIDFLRNLRSLLCGYSHAIFETFTSGMFYAISCGLSVGYFPQTQTELEFGTEVHQASHLWMSRNLPGVVGEFVEARELSGQNNEMLGVESLLTPGGLRDLLTYQTGVVPVV